MATAFAEVLILPDPSNPSDITPLQLANQLNDNRNRLKLLIPTLDESYVIVGTELISASPKFLRTPIVNGESFGNSVSITYTSLENTGTMYLCFVKVETN